MTIMARRVSDRDAPLLRARGRARSQHTFSTLATCMQHTASKQTAEQLLNDSAEQPLNNSADQPLNNSHVARLYERRQAPLFAAAHIYNRGVHPLTGVHPHERQRAHIRTYGHP
jgi:hypothetical protein